MRDMDGVAYLNDGDWVESCTALVEGFDGRIRISHRLEVRKPDVNRRLPMAA